MRSAIAIVTLAACGASASSQAAPEGYGQYHALTIKGGVFHGPGRMPDSPLPKGKLGYIEFREQLIGETQFFNNGAEPPNIESEAKMGGTPDGLLSNGRPFNEHIEGGIAEVGRGAMRFLTVVAFDGPNKGKELYRLGPDYNLHVTIDMALDPGFPEGLLITENLSITTGLLWAPTSLQRKQGIGGGTDQAGSLPSGVAVIGRLGDYDLDGLIDGRLVGSANVPLTHIFTPGEPVVQTREFTSDIPIKPLDAALLSVASTLNYQPVWDALAQPAPKDRLTAWKYMESNVGKYLEDITMRLEATGKLLDKSPPRDELSKLSSKVRELATLTRGYATGEGGKGGARHESMQALFQQVTDVTKELSAFTSLKTEPKT